MSIVIERDGWKISGNTISDLAMGVAAVQQALQSTEPTGGRAGGRTPKAPQNGGMTDTANKERRKTKVIPFLRAIANAPGGITATKLVETAKMGGKVMIGAHAKIVNKMLIDCGFKTDAVYVWKKKAGEEKTWFPKSQIEEAIKAVEGL